LGKTAMAPLTRGVLAGLFFVLFVAIGEPEANAQKFCTNTAKDAFKACGFEGKDDYWTAVGKCNNEADPKSCIAEAKEERKSKKEECKEQFEARKEVCDLVGEAAYNPAFDPADFVMDAVAMFECSRTSHDRCFCECPQSEFFGSSLGGPLET
jgi:hypothetical protein